MKAQGRASERLGVILIFFFLVLLREFVSAVFIWCGRGSLQAAWCMGGECRHEVMAKGNRAWLCRMSWGGSCCGVGRPLYQLGNVWGRLGGNFITLCWAVPLMCYQTSARDPAVSWAAWAPAESCWAESAMTEKREGVGKGKSDNLPPKQTPGGFALDGLPIAVRQRCWSVHCVMKMVGWSVHVCSAIPACCTQPCWAGIFGKPWRSFPPLLPFEEDQNAKRCVRNNTETGVPTFPFKMKS